MPPAGKRERREKGEGGGAVGMAGCTGRRWQRMEGVVVRIAMASCSVKTTGACGDISCTVTRLAGRCAHLLLHERKEMGEGEGLDCFSF